MEVVSFADFKFDMVYRYLRQEDITSEERRSPEDEDTSDREGLFASV